MKKLGITKDSSEYNVGKAEEQKYGTINGASQGAMLL